MCKPYTKKIIASIALLTASVSFSALTFAAEHDINQEIVIKSKRQAGDLKNKIASYLDDVIITQGTLTIKADIVQVYSQANSDQETYVAKGNPATFEQLLDDGTPINLQANEIAYEPSINTITISGNALLRQAGSEVSGSKIVYNTKTQQLEAESSSDESVTTILKPQKNKGDN